MAASKASAFGAMVCSALSRRNPEIWATGIQLTSVSSIARTGVVSRPGALKCRRHLREKRTPVRHHGQEQGHANAALRSFRP